MKKLRFPMQILLALIFVGSVGMLLRQVFLYSENRQSYSQAQMIAFGDTRPETVAPELIEIPEQTLPLSETAPAVIPMDEGAEFLSEVNIWALRQINPDVLGWIYIPDTVISYPLMQTSDRDTYLHTAWDGKYNSGGSIFLEQKNNRDLSDFNTILYGHHMTDGSMFGSLKHFKDPSFAESHPYIYLCTADQVCRYRVFSVYDAPVDSDTYRLYFPDTETKERALRHFITSSLLDLPADMTAEDRFLTLSTCIGNGVYTNRIVVQAVLDSQWQK